MTPERAIQNEICSYLKSLGAFVFIHDSVGIYDVKRGCFRVNRSSHRIRGVADILGIFKGYPLAVEVKTKTGKLSEHQREFLESWRRAGGIGLVARSVDDCHSEIQRQFVALGGLNRGLAVAKPGGLAP